MLPRWVAEGKADVESGEEHAKVKRAYEDLHFDTRIGMLDFKHLEQDHRFIKKRMAASLWFRSAEGALKTIDGYEPQTCASTALTFSSPLSVRKDAKEIEIWRLQPERFFHRRTGNIRAAIRAKLYIYA